MRRWVLSLLLAAAFLPASIWLGGAPPLHAQASPEASGHEAYRMGRYEEAVGIWRSAADAGDAGAAWRMAQEYIDAKFLKRDLDQAVSYLEIAVAKGDARAESELANLYDSGLGVRRNKRRAAELYLSAANKGLGAAQFNIAVMLETGDGIRRNRVEAYKYFLLARERGFGPFANPNLQKLARRLSKKEIAEATLAAEEFAPAY